MPKNKSIVSQIISGFLKFLAATVFILAVIVIIIPSFLSIVKGKDILPVDDSALQLQTVSIPKEENAFYDLNKLYDTEKHQELISLKNVPKGKQLASDYLNSDEWNQESVKQLLIDNEEALQSFASAAVKGKFQLPDADTPSKISSEMPVTPLNTWREISRLSGVKAIWLAKDGKNKEAIDEAFKSIIIGNAIENSQSLLVTYLVGIEVKSNGLDVLQKVISMIPKDSTVLSDYQSKLENYQAIGNQAPFAAEYLVCKQSWDNFGQDGKANLRTGVKILIKNKFYFKKNLTISYCFDFYSKLALESKKDCLDVKKVQEPAMPLEANNLMKMYFTENVIGKYFMSSTKNGIALNNVLEKKCATENKLKETILIINSTDENCEFAACPSGDAGTGKNDVDFKSGFENSRIERAIIDYLTNENRSGKEEAEGSFSYCTIENLDSDQKLFPFYIWAYCGEYKFENGKLKNTSGSSLPMKINYPNELSYYNPSHFSYEIPRDGSDYPEDIKRIFSVTAQRNIIDYDSAAIKKKNEASALANAFVWESIKKAVNDCSVEAAFQAHSHLVNVTLKNRNELEAVEPGIDDIMEIVDGAKDKCGNIRISTE